MLEVKELVVHANINPTPIDPATGKKEDNCEQDSANSSEGANEEIVQACVRQVLAILERQKER
jgi:hypothetical protein